MAALPKRAIVLAEDSKKRGLLEEDLRRSGHEVTFAQTCEEVMTMVTLLAPDVIVLDVMLRYKDGFEVLRRLKANPETRNIPVIMWTAKALDADVFKGCEIDPWQTRFDD